MKQGGSPLHLKRPRYTRQAGAPARQEQGASDLKTDTQRQGALYTLLLRIQWAGSQHGLKYHLESGSFVYPYDVTQKRGRLS